MNLKKKEVALKRIINLPEGLRPEVSAPDLEIGLCIYKNVCQKAGGSSFEGLYLGSLFCFAGVCICYCAST